MEESTPKPHCYACDSRDVLTCSGCQQPYCFDHASLFDKGKCIACGPNIAYEVERSETTVTGKDGLGHKVQQLRILGDGWPDRMAHIEDMSEKELEEWIEFLKVRLKLVLQTRDTLHICISAGENTLFNKRVEKVRAERGYKIPGVKVVDPSRPKAKLPAEILAARLGLSLEKAEAVLRTLKTK